MARSGADEHFVDSEVNSAQTWIRSTWSMTNGNCVEVAPQPGQFIRVRDSKNPFGAVLGFPSAEWNAFVGAVRDGELGR
jgi:Domain of unknown function (DUF397)